MGDHLGQLEFAVWIYIVWYLYRGMRNVYQQRRGITVAKYFAIGFFYFCAALTVLLLTALFSAMTLCARNACAVSSIDRKLPSSTPRSLP